VAIFFHSLAENTGSFQPALKSTAPGLYAKNMQIFLVAFDEACRWSILSQLEHANFFTFVDGGTNIF